MLAVRLLLGGFAILLLIAPALWNGFPLIFADTGGYLARPFDHTLLLGRSALYGVLLAASAPLAFWPTLVLQAALCVWLIGILLRVHGFAAAAPLTAGIVLCLCAVTGIAFYAAQLVPDIFVPLAVLALCLLAFHNAALTRAERYALLVLVAFAIAFHMAILALALSVLCGFLLLRWLARWIGLPRPGLALPALAIAAGLALALLSNFAIAGRLALTPGGTSFLFARLIQDGLIARYLADRCPDEEIRLCAYRDRLPQTADDWLWANHTPFYALGGTEGYEAEERRIILQTLTAYPWQHLQTAVTSTLQQLVTLRTMTSVQAADNDHALGTLARLTPDLMPQILRAEQQKRGAFDLSSFNRVHEPVGLLACALVALAVVLGWRSLAPPVLGLLLTVAFALLANAAIAGIFSNPVDRYQSRMIWLAVLALIVALLSRGRTSYLPR